jgi:hypothetical protein
MPDDMKFIKELQVHYSLVCRVSVLEGSAISDSPTAMRVV